MGFIEGVDVGDWVGALVGRDVGIVVGSVVGDTEGTVDGVGVGTRVGAVVGTIVGSDEDASSVRVTPSTRVDVSRAPHETKSASYNMTKILKSLAGMVTASKLLNCTSRLSVPVEF